MWSRRPDSHSTIAGRRIEASRMHATQSVARATRVLTTYWVHIQLQRSRRWKRKQIFISPNQFHFLILFSIAGAQTFALYARMLDYVVASTIDLRSIGILSDALHSTMVAAAVTRITSWRKKNANRHANALHLHRLQHNRHVVWLWIDSPPITNVDFTLIITIF